MRERRRTPPFRLRRGLTVLLSCFCITSTGAGATVRSDHLRVPLHVLPGDTVPSGRLIERVASAADPARSYALLLPPGHGDGTPRPLLLVLDPRGRAARALDLFRRPAARRGWIVMSSYDTRSDTTGDVNEEALRAMIADANDRLGVDGRRLYLAGFSGTARIGWVVASTLSDHVAGLIGVGAGFPPALETMMRTDARTLPASFSFWGGAGRLGFNHDEVRRLDATLDQLGIRHRIEFYPGRHGWLPPEHAAAAIDWLELQAMRSGLAARDDALVDSLHRSALAAARSAEAAGRPVEALRRWQRVADDFAGLRPVADARAGVRALEDHPAVRRRRERLEREARQREAFLERMREVLEEDSGLGPADAAEELELEALRRRAAGTGDTLDAQAAGRLLEQLYVQTSFYLPRRALRGGEPGRALAYLELAERARPDRRRTAWFRARALAQAGREREAVAELRELVGAGVPRSALADDPWLAPLRKAPGWRELVEGGSSP